MQEKCQTKFPLSPQNLLVQSLIVCEENDLLSRTEKRNIRREDPTELITPVYCSGPQLMDTLACVYTVFGPSAGMLILRFTNKTPYLQTSHMCHKIVQKSKSGSLYSVLEMIISLDLQINSYIPPGTA